jgi:preprotein translocase subunit Sec63
MTGGVSTTLTTTRILSKDKLWQELLHVNKEFIFAASSPYWGRREHARQGVPLNHAYSILKAVEVEGEDGKNVRLVLIR